MFCNFLNIKIFVRYHKHHITYFPLNVNNLSVKLTAVDIRTRGPIFGRYQQIDSMQMKSAHTPIEYIHHRPPRLGS